MIALMDLRDMLRRWWQALFVHAPFRQPVLWDGNNLPPIGCEVDITHGSDNGEKRHRCIVTGYEIWPSLGSSMKNGKPCGYYKRILVHVRYKNIDDCTNARHLCEVLKPE